MVHLTHYAVCCIVYNTFSTLYRDNLFETLQYGSLNFIYYNAALECQHSNLPERHDLAVKPIIKDLETGQDHHRFDDLHGLLIWVAWKKENRLKSILSGLMA